MPPRHHQRAASAAASASHHQSLLMHILVLMIAITSDLQLKLAAVTSASVVAECVSLFSTQVHVQLQINGILRHK